MEKPESHYQITSDNGPSLKKTRIVLWRIKYTGTLPNLKMPSTETKTPPVIYDQKPT
jgi:hypothetical protein